jgi:dGTPase
MMDWNLLLSAKRFGQEDRKVQSVADARSQFQRDYDRLVFSAPFRRLQNKTQVFPLPGSVFVHNRLTHSLEVASVGRSLAHGVAAHLRETDLLENKELLNELASIVGAACLAHDMGNPPFGHAGEDAISRYFKSAQGSWLREYLSEAQWLDLTHFEGNANALRLLTTQFKGRREGGYVLTYSTLASLIKYPYSSRATTQGMKKYGYFQSESQTFKQIVQELGLEKIGDDPEVYARHPLVYLVEAADDICYEIMDIEDAHKLKILETGVTQELLMGFFDPADEVFKAKTRSVFREVTDINEQIAYLRAAVIGKLIGECVHIFWENHEKIVSGTFQKGLVDHLEGTSKEAFDQCRQVAVHQIYQHRSVVKIELTGYSVMGKLLDAFSHAVLNPSDGYSRKLLSLVPNQYHVMDDEVYFRLMGIVDFISGMTDLYALDLYKDIQGIR